MTVTILYTQFINPETDTLLEGSERLYRPIAVSPSDETFTLSKFTCPERPFIVLVCEPNLLSVKVFLDRDTAAGSSLTREASAEPPRRCSGTHGRYASSLYRRALLTPAL